MNDFNAIATEYIYAFNTIDSAERKRLVADVFAADVSYVDPMAAVAGHDGVDSFIAGAHQQFPGWVLKLVGPVDGHGQQARFSWRLGPEGVEARLPGSTWSSSVSTVGSPRFSVSLTRCRPPDAARQSRA